MTEISVTIDTPECQVDITVSHKDLQKASEMAAVQMGLAVTAISDAQTSNEPLSLTVDQMLEKAGEAGAGISFINSIEALKNRVILLNSMSDAEEKSDGDIAKS